LPQVLWALGAEEDIWS